MKTGCPDGTEFRGLGNREVAGTSDGGMITSDGGGILPREVGERTEIIKRFPECLTDYRDEDRIGHTVAELASRRIMGLASGYEDTDDHDDLRCDPLLALISGKEEPTGSDRRCERDRGKALAGKSTPDRMELAPEDADEKSRSEKITADHEATDGLLPELSVGARPTPPKQIISDADATYDPVRGDREGKFFQGYYECYCYLPLHVFCGGHLPCARLRPSDTDASDGTADGLGRIVGRIRKPCPNVEIIIGGDSSVVRKSCHGARRMMSVTYSDWL